MTTPRKTRSDKQVKTIEKELGVKLYKEDGKRQPAKKKLATIRKEQAPAKSADQKIAAKRTVKSNPKAKASVAKKVSTVIKKSSKK